MWIFNSVTVWCSIFYLCLQNSLGCIDTADGPVHTACLYHLKLLKSYNITAQWVRVVITLNNFMYPSVFPHIRKDPLEFLHYSEMYTNTKTWLKFGKYWTRLLTGLCLMCFLNSSPFFSPLKMMPWHLIETLSNSTQYVRRTKIPVYSTFVGSILIGVIGRGWPRWWYNRRWFSYRLICRLVRDMLVPVRTTDVKGATEILWM